MSALDIPKRPGGRWKPWAALAAVVMITAVAMSPQVGIAFTFDPIVRNWGNGVTKVVQLLQPDWTVFPRTVGPMLQTLEMAVIATALSAIVSLPLSLAAARLTNPSRWGRRIVRFIVNVVRAVPDLVYASVLVAMVGVGALPGIIALLLFNVGIIVKMVSENIEGDDAGPIEAGRAAGGTQFQINRAIAMSDTMPAFVSQTLYVLELNVRVSTVLGFVGAGGIGLLIDAVRSYYRYDQLSVMILEVLVIVMLIDVASDALRRRLV